ncbi:MAG: 3D domain-containing protein [Armatimonadetes bacterium]|nr:3D domain-containing protein [Armatimonadota bacterium]MDW8121240.1 3D domain-containing protein [Armatimonadota bacterium]
MEKWKRLSRRIGYVGAGLFTICVAAGQKNRGEIGPSATGVNKPVEVQGFADVIEDRKQPRLLLPSAREDVSKQAVPLLKSFNLRQPARTSGWKYADYGLERFRRLLAARGGHYRGRLLRMEATAYCPRGCCGSGGGRTASGRRAEYGIAAVDPRVIPLGTALYVDGYGFAIAADVGTAIKGNRIDLCFPTHREANLFGRRTVRVLILR